MIFVPYIVEHIAEEFNDDLYIAFISFHEAVCRPVTGIERELLGTKVPSIWKQFQILIMCRCKWAATTNPVHRGTTAGK